MSFPIDLNGRLFFNPALFNTDTPGFDAALKDAIQRRAQVEGRPPESHGYEIATPAMPNDCLTKIAVTRNVDPPAVIDANRQFPDPNAINPGDIVFVPEKSPVSAKTETLIDDAVRFDREHPGDVAGGNRHWEKVQAAVADELRDHGKGKALPERDATATVARISDWALGTDRLKTTANAALTQVTGEWHAAGVTQDTLGKIETSYGAFQRAQAHETALENDPKASAADRAAARADTDRQAGLVRDEIACQLAAPADPNALPLDRLANLQDHAQRIKALGPQDGDFRSLVDLAGRKVLVDDPAQHVADAYAHGGAVEAARQLKTETAGTASDYAAQIIIAAQPTLDRIAADVGSKTQYIQDNVGAYGKEGEKRAQAFEDVDNIYGDLAGAVEVAGQSKSYGRPAVIATADALAAHAPEHMSYPGSPLMESVRDTSLHDGNTTLSLAFAGALQRRHREGQAALIAEQVAQDIEEQRQITEEATNNFFKLTGELSQLRADWAGMLTPEQMDKATRGYANRRPGFLDDFAISLKNLQKEGNDANTIARAVATYGDQVKGINVPGTNAEANIDKYRHNLTGDNTKLAFAMQQGGQSNADISGALHGGPGGPGDVGKAANPVPTTRSVRTLVKESVKAFQPQLSDTFAAPLNGAGSLLYAIGVSQSATQVGARPNVVTVAGATYQAIGFTKETSELLARMAPSALLERSALVNRAADLVLKSKGWKIFDTYFKVGAVGVDTAKGVDYLLQGDPVAALLSTASASGNAILALSAARAAETPVLATLAARLPAGFSSGPWGAAIVVAATAGQYLWSRHVADRQQTERQEDGTRDFLVDSGAVPPEVADVLKETDGDHHSIGPLLAALAGHDQVQGPQMLAFLNRQDLDQLKLFVDIAHGVKPDDQGVYPQTARNDENFLFPGMPSYTALPQGDRMPHSLRGLSLREPAVFGSGDSPRTAVG